VRPPCQHLRSLLQQRRRHLQPARHIRASACT
jgi:hypothetical protein